MRSVSTGPPSALVRSLVEGPSPVAGVEWHDEVASTQLRAQEVARDGVPEIHVVLADVQTAGRGRLGRTWHAPAGTSLLASCVLRPTVRTGSLTLLPLLAGLALAEVVDRYCDAVALKWPNDLMVHDRKAAGVLVEGPLAGGAVVLGLGVNVDWRGVALPAGAAESTSLAEMSGAHVDRWRVLAAFLGLFGRRYLDWQEHPVGFLDDYRRWCATIGRRVRGGRPTGGVVEGLAEGVEDDGALGVRDDAGVRHRIAAGDVAYVRPV